MLNYLGGLVRSSLQMSGCVECQGHLSVLLGCIEVRRGGGLLQDLDTLLGVENEAGEGVVKAVLILVFGYGLDGQDVGHPAPGPAGLGLGVRGRSERRVGHGAEDGGEGSTHGSTRAAPRAGRSIPTTAQHFEILSSFLRRKVETLFFEVTNEEVE